MQPQKMSLLRQQIPRFPGAGIVDIVIFVCVPTLEQQKPVTRLPDFGLSEIEMERDEFLTFRTKVEKLRWGDAEEESGFRIPVAEHVAVREGGVRDKRVPVFAYGFESN